MELFRSCFAFLDDSDIPRLAERLVEIVDRSRFPDGKKSIVVVERALSLEEDGGSASKPIPPAEDDGLGEVFFPSWGHFLLLIFCSRPLSTWALPMISIRTQVLDEALTCFLYAS